MVKANKTLILTQSTNLFNNDAIKNF